MSEPNSPGPSVNDEPAECVEDEEVEEDIEESSPSVKAALAKPPLAGGGRHPSQSLPYIGDPHLVSRIVEYINALQDSNTAGERFIDVEDIVNELQRRYREYRKKKRQPFKATVQKALTIIMKARRSDREDEEMESSEMSEEDSDMLELSKQAGNINGLPCATIRPSGKMVMEDDQELIEIGSSEDEEEEAEPEPSREMQAILRQENMRKAAALSSQSRKSQEQNGSSHFGHHVPLQPVEERPRAPPNILRKRKTPPEINTGIQNRVGGPAKKFKYGGEPHSTGVTFKDIGGNEACLKEVCQLLVHVKHPEVYETLGVSPPRGFLLHGPPGCGKSLLARAIAGELQVQLIRVAATELVAGVSGESEERIRELFEQATDAAPCVLFLDEIDAIAPHRANAQREMERRIVAQLLSSMDDLAQSSAPVLVVGATNRPDALDPALRRAGRFDREVCLGIPDAKARSSILAVLCSKLRLDPAVDLQDLGKLTPGFVGADLAALTREAAMTAVNRVLGTLKSQQNEKKASDKETTADQEPAVDTEVPKKDPADEAAVNGDEKMEEEAPASSEDKSPAKVAEEPAIVAEAPVQKQTLSQLTLAELMEWLQEKPPLTKQQLADLHIEQADFEKALKSVQPSAKREGFATVPDVTWDDVGSLKDVREELKMTILAPVKYAEEFATLGLTSPAGVLLCGPPGCGKTLLAKAVANEAGINFISVKGPELLNMYVGESERAVRQCFQRAKNSAPCVIFFDELDSLCPKRSDSGEGGASMRVVNQMLTEMDGIEGRRGVFLMAATNRPDIVDPAVLRPGRLDKILYIGLPNAEDRTDILRAITKGGTAPQMSPQVSLALLGEDSEGYTGADLAALVREASLQALRAVMAGEEGAELVVQKRHFGAALAKIRPSVSDLDKKRYESLRLLYGPKSQE